ncbi:uncharacterized protein LOC130077158 [Rhinichthys klamathensis goyatoka]|uniref:uncharacterized protein LOC130077158 n=1 Tax=Rhinichthys klamathensis goyatoka TaxID=3034132 RepID=UPI0024B55162|nr:uncharacterized protein LOC130077158 [Rhinichthys klamathensis goyatoka]
MDQQEENLAVTGRAVQALVAQVSELTQQLQHLAVPTAPSPPPIPQLPPAPDHQPEPRLPAPEMYAGRAALWGTAVWENQHQCCSSFQTLSEEMKRVFDRATTGREAARQLADLRQGNRSVSDYAIDFRTLAAECYWNEEQQIFTLDLPKRFDELVELALRVDARLHQLEQRTRAAQGPVSVRDLQSSGSDAVSPAYNPEPMQTEVANLSNVPAEYRDLQEVFTGAGFFFVGKKYGSLRPCIDYRGLNNITKPLLKGSFHQGDARFGNSRGRQCGAISLIAVLMSKMKNVLTWTTQDLNGVLVAGTRLYESLRNQGPCQTKSIKPDGNCFFRSLAYAICGSEDKHLKIRRAVVKHLKMNASIFERYVRSEYTSVEDYLIQSRVYYSGSWVTEIDIFASADLFKTTIMTFNDGRWNAHKPTGEVIVNNAIYLKNCNGNHYEVVTCVKHRDQDICAAKCGNATSNEVRMLCLRKRKVSDAAECDQETKRQKQWKYEKSKYDSDIDFRQNKIAHAKTKYRDVQFQKHVCQYSQMKYKNNVSFQATVREYSKKKYLQNLAFNTRVREYSKKKYLQNLAFNTRVREYSKKKYLQNLAFNTRVREYSKKKYLQNLDFKVRVREYSKTKYHKDVNFHFSKIQKGCEVYAKKREKQKDIGVAIAGFRQEVSRGPEFVCCVCHRLLFRKQVTECKPECYEDKGDKIAALARRCITLRLRSMKVCSSSQVKTIPRSIQS